MTEPLQFHTFGPKTLAIQTVPVVLASEFSKR